MIPKILLFGDSITQRSFGDLFFLESNSDGASKVSPPCYGWGSLLSAIFQRRCDVVSRGLSGFTTRMARGVVEQVCSRDSVGECVRLVTVWFGANDAALEGVSPQHISVEEYGVNLAEILSRIRSLHPEATIIVFTPPPVDEDNWKRNTEGGVLNRTNAAARQYADKAIDVAKNFQNTHLYDVHRYLEGDADRANYAKYLNDGLHLSEEGNKKVFEGLMGTLEAHCKEEIWPVDEVCPFEEKVWRDML